MGKVKVLHVCTIPLTARTFISPLARYLEGQGYEVIIACSDGWDPESGSAMDEMRKARFKMAPIPIPRTIQPQGDVHAVMRLYKLIRQERFAIVHTQTTKAGFVGRCAARLAGVPVVIHTAHAFPFHPYLPPLRRKLYAFAERIAARWADLIMVDTDAVRDDGLRHRIAAPDKILTVPIGVNLDRFSRHRIDSLGVRSAWGIPPGAPVVGTVARLVPDKGLECLLDAAGRVAAVHDRVWFLIVGGGPLQPVLQRQAERLRIADRVVFAGVRSDIPEQMAAMDLFVLPTLREGFGLVFAESMAMETPVVATDIPPVREVVVNGETGVLLPSGDVGRFAAAILDLLGDGPRRRAMGRAGRQRVKQLFDERKIFAQIEAEYRRLLRAKGIAPSRLGFEQQGASEPHSAP